MLIVLASCNTNTNQASKQQAQGVATADNIYNIKSCDTSNPVVAAIKGYRYNDEMGLQHKPSTLLADLIDYVMSDDQIEDLDYNTKMFKKILKR